MEKRTFRENSVIFDPTDDQIINDGQSIIETPDKQKPQAALPNGIPQPVSVGHLPDNILKSGALNALIQQNEDLLARLSISLRRYAQLEEQLEEKNEELETLANNTSHYKDQALILDEKVKLIEDRTRDVREKNNLLEHEISLLETRYSELYSRNQVKIESLNSQISSWKKTTGRLKRYRHRVLKLAASLRKQIFEKNELVKKLETEYAILSESFDAMRTRMAASAEHIQHQEKEHQKNIASLTDHYESEFTELKDSIESKANEIENLILDKIKWEGVEEKNIELENQMVFMERKLSEIREKHGHEVEEIQTELGKHRKEAKQRTLENQDLILANQDLNDSLQQERQRAADLENQVESLQVVWGSNQESLEKEKQKNESLQKLNQQISLSLNEARQEIKQLKAAQETQRLKNADAIKLLESELQSLRQANESEV